MIKLGRKYILHTIVLILLVDNEVKIVQLCCFDIQLAICIEKKQQLNEEYHDCIGSEDGHSVIMVKFL